MAIVTRYNDSYQVLKSDRFYPQYKDISSGAWVTFKRTTDATTVSKPTLASAMRYIETHISSGAEKRRIAFEQRALKSVF